MGDAQGFEYVYAAYLLTILVVAGYAGRLVLLSLNVRRRLLRLNPDRNRPERPGPSQNEVAGAAPVAGRRSGENRG